MHGNYMNVISCVVVCQSDIKSPVGSDHGHHQAFRKRLGIIVVLKNFSLLHHLLGLVAGNPAFLKPKQGMIAPFDPVPTYR